MPAVILACNSEYSVTETLQESICSQLRRNREEAMKLYFHLLYCVNIHLNNFHNYLAADVNFYMILRGHSNPLQLKCT